MKKRISKSQVSEFLACEARWAFRYVEGVKRPAGSDAAFGVALHEGCLGSLEQKIESGEDLPPAEVAEMTVAALEESRDEFEWDQPFATVKDALPATAEVFQLEAAPSIKPLAVEEKLEVEVADADWGLVGYIDVRTEEGGRDLKTARSRWPKGRERTELQPVLYTLDEPGESRFGFDICVRNKTPKVDIRERVVTEGEKRAALRLLGGLRSRMELLERGLMPALPTGYGGMLCSRRWCRFWDLCEERHGLPVKEV
jgi:hypothetical protein